MLKSLKIIVKLGRSEFFFFLTPNPFFPKVVFLYYYLNARILKPLVQRFLAADRFYKQKTL